MQLKIRHTLSEELALPLSYHHIIQGIIYRGLADESGYCRHMHNSGYAADNVNNMGRRYKLFNFSLMRGNYQVINGQIIFRDYVEWEIRSPDIYMMRLLESLYEATNASQGNRDAWWQLWIAIGAIVIIDVIVNIIAIVADHGWSGMLQWLYNILGTGV